ncbi:Histidine--tRNA ligase, mitochondrial [Cytospora mali]|uniref:histidine--tRNA ligase n=1 Tax=Cytospora mali TaxID=578113 RepID=A0A194VNG6_CYTMA|nr:Histidine--tRNA ligase, mitochondrial [Valsa mali]
MATEDTNTSSRAVPVQLKTPKGTVDFMGTETKVRKHIFRTLGDVFERHGGQELNTPVFELREILSGKYGEDSKLIYDLEDQGGELCSLRYDLTVPFARWLAMNTNHRQVSRYQIAKVYRRDQPAMSRGRYREFYQCDFDIAGEYEPMIPDAEILLIIVEGFSALELDVTIKLNHRRILDGIFAVAGVPEDKIRPVSSAVDKLDKMPWEEVKAEMVGEKGLPGNVADRIGQLICGSGSGDMRKMLASLKEDPSLTANDSIKAGMDDMEILLSYLEAFDIVDKISFDLSLARGLDYYTGLIFEVITSLPNDSKTPASNSKYKSKGAQVGSIAAGGRYDNLVGMYGDRNIPCVGVSFGVERIYTILDARQPKSSKGGQSLLAQDVDVYVVAAGSDGLLLERMAVCGLLTKAGIKAAFLRKAKPSMRSQFNAADNAPLSVILGPDELAAGNVRLKVSAGKNAGRGKDSGAEGRRGEKDRGQLVAKNDLVTEVNRILKSMPSRDADS